MWWGEKRAVYYDVLKGPGQMLEGELGSCLAGFGFGVFDLEARDSPVAGEGGGGCGRASSAAAQRRSRDSQINVSRTLRLAAGHSPQEVQSRQRRPRDPSTSSACSLVTAESLQFSGPYNPASPGSAKRN